jgi:allantoicase
MVQWMDTRSIKAKGGMDGWSTRDGARAVDCVWASMTMGVVEGRMVGTDAEPVVMYVCMYE